MDIIKNILEIAKCIIVIAVQLYVLISKIKENRKRGKK